MRQLRWVTVTMCLACSPAAAAPYLFDVIKKPSYARALKSLLDHAANLPDWIKETRKTKGDYVASISPRQSQNETRLFGFLIRHRVFTMARSGSLGLD